MVSRESGFLFFSCVRVKKTVWFCWLVYILRLEYGCLSLMLNKSLDNIVFIILIFWKDIHINFWSEGVFSMRKLWNLICSLISQGCSLACLQLLHSKLPLVLVETDLKELFFLRQPLIHLVRLLYQCTLLLFHQVFLLELLYWLDHIGKPLLLWLVIQEVAFSLLSFLS